ncbi:MAG TPA: aldo/keto reductase [Nitrospira sp.]|nr:aldo/keto reductase [Nitrospira sp.]
MDATRRDVLRLGIAVAGMTAGAMTRSFANDATAPPHPSSIRKGDMLYRTLGSTGEQVSVVGLGGYHIGQPADEQEAIRLIRSAIDHGVNFMDNCWDYHEGASEMRMGKALRDGYRAKAFVMTKIDGRTKQEAAKQIEDSLKRLQTDHIDLMQHHEIIRMEDPDRIFADGGAQEAMVQAKKAGKIRYLGFTGHKDPVVHLRMLEVAAKHHFRFDAVQMPLNVMDAHFRSFEHHVLPVLVKEHIGVLGMKSMAGTHILKTNTATAVECLHYAMTLPTSVVITGIESMKILDQALQAVRTFEPMTASQITALLNRTAAAAAEGRYEPFKTTEKFDGTARNPQWLG